MWSPLRTIAHSSTSQGTERNRTDVSTSTHSSSSGPKPANRRLAGLYLASRQVPWDDTAAVVQVFNAVGFHFVSRLLRTGMNEDNDKQNAYLPLAISIFAAFCRVPELASRNEVINEVPVVVQALNKKEHWNVLTDACECLLSVATATENGFLAVCESMVFPALAAMFDFCPPDCQATGIGVKLAVYLVTKVTVENRLMEHYGQFAGMVSPLSKQLSRQQDIAKFEVLKLLNLLLLSPLTRRALESKRFGSWPSDVRTGLGHILYSRVGAEYKNAALDLAENMVELLGENWLIGTITIPDREISAAPDRFLLLLVEMLRVESVVTLGELCQCIEGEQAHPELERKHRNLATYYALLEHVINLLCEGDGELQPSTLSKLIGAIDEIVGVVLQLLECAKDRGISAGDELLSSVRLVGRYLADAPMAHNERVLKVLGFALSITAEGQRPFLAVTFLVPALRELTLEEKACEALLSCGAHKQVVEFVVWTVENAGETDLVKAACDIFLNLLLKKDSLIEDVSYLDFVPVLPPLAAWAVNLNRATELCLISCLCITVLSMTSESALRNCFGDLELRMIFTLVDKTLQLGHEGKLEQEEDLLGLIISGCEKCLDHYPSLKSSLRSSAWLSGDSALQVRISSLVA